MRFGKKPLIAPREILVLTALAAIALALIGALLAADIRISQVSGGGGEFFSAWSGARAFLGQHAGPYESASIALGQQLAYGRRAEFGENPYILTTPFFLLPLYYPFAIISTASTARAVWMCLSQLALIGAACLALRLIEWRRPLVFTVLYLLVSVFSYYSVAAIQEGTPAILLGLLYVGTLWAYHTRRDELAGAFLVLCLFRWEIGGPFLALFGWRILYQKRWRILIGLAMTLVILLAVSFFTDPTWVLPFLSATLATIRASFGLTTTSVLLNLWPEYGAALAKLASVLVIGLLVYEGATGRDSEFRSFVWLSCLALSTAPLIGFRTEISSLVVMHPALALICTAFVSRGHTGRWLAGIILLIALVVPWLTFVRGWLPVDENHYDFIFLLLPLLCTVGLYWTRWWFLHPQRTVADEVRGAVT